MNKEKILEMIRPFVKDNQLTWNELDEIFYMLSNKEKYSAADFLMDDLKIFIVDEKDFSAQEDFQFVDYVLSAVKPYIENQQLTYEEFDEIFSHLEKRKQYDVANILSELNIMLVDEKIFPAQVEETLQQKNFPPQPEEIILRKVDEIKLSNNVLARLAQTGDKQALQDLLVKNRGLVLKYVKRYDKIFNHSLSAEDLVQEGMRGMMRAVKDFDLNQGTQFTTYAFYWIHQAVSGAIYNDGFAVRLPVHIFEKIIKVNDLDRKFSLQEENFSARVELIAKEMSMPVDDVHKIFFCAMNI